MQTRENITTNIIFSIYIAPPKCYILFLNTQSIIEIAADYCFKKSTSQRNGLTASVLLTPKTTRTVNWNSEMVGKDSSPRKESLEDYLTRPLCERCRAPPNLSSTSLAFLLNYTREALNTAWALTDRMQPPAGEVDSLGKETDVRAFNDSKGICVWVDGLGKCKNMWKLPVARCLYICIYD